MCGRNESLSCAPVKKSILPEKMIGQNRKLGRTLDGQPASSTANHSTADSECKTSSGTTSLQN